MVNPLVTGFFEPKTFSIAYVVADPRTRTAAVIDPVLNFEARGARTATTFAETIVEHVARHELRVAWVLETHIHADHLTASQFIRSRLGGKLGIGSNVPEVQRTFAGVYNAEPGFRADGSQFDRLFQDGARFEIGDLNAEVLHTPGHTPACVSYRIGDAVFVGDAIFMPDYGTARCDFPGGNATTLYRSIRRILSLPPETRVFVGHDYGPDGRPFAWESTVGEERAKNKHIHDGVTEADFVAMRLKRDRELTLPDLILPAIQVNMRAGNLPPADSNGIVYLRLPLNTL
ncbi:MAG TPA: MBL fold metallo-hydrolase [Candidatus Cybelea sp.]|nr:MBL fold metallo-hydrolase [Candidatus Cybelea sp.]